MQTKFDIIWGRFHNKLEWLVKSKISNNEDAQDVLQNIFVKIYKNIDRLDDIEKLSSWINKVAKNTIIGIGLTGTISVILTNAPLNKTINNSKTCINCMRCLKVCPIRDVANAKGDLDNCACGKCVNICPV